MPEPTRGLFLEGSLSAIGADRAAAGAYRAAVEAIVKDKVMTSGDLKERINALIEAGVDENTVRDHHEARLTGTGACMKERRSRTKRLRTLRNSSSTLVMSCMRNHQSVKRCVLPGRPSVGGRSAGSDARGLSRYTLAICPPWLSSEPLASWANLGSRAWYVWRRCWIVSAWLDGALLVGIEAWTLGRWTHASV